MRRRTLLAGIGGVVASLGGCAAIDPPGIDRDEGPSGATPGESPATETTTGDTNGTETTTSEFGLANEGFPSTVCEEEIDEEFTIRAIAEPAFGQDWSGIDFDDKYSRGADGLPDEMTVVGMETENRARAYPLSVLWSHEIVNDDFGGPVLVTYCSICRSGMTAERIVDGEATIFGVSGLLWQAPEIYARAAEEQGEVFGASVEESDAELRNSGNLVMYDEATRSYWSQILATAICGPKEGADLTLVPSTLTSWAEWREEHSETDVLLPPPHSGLM